MECGAGAVDGFDSYVMRGGLALGALPVVCFEENVCMFVVACVTDVEFSEAVNVIDDVVKEAGLESA